ncbi:MAG TPA: leucyl aminopeptidase [Acidimicrobiales bacterium]|nr:leucyl aminopeptidase [Acidimicrobiales bacterium]
MVVRLEAAERAEGADAVAVGVVEGPRRLDGGELDAAAAERAGFRAALGETWVRERPGALEVLVGLGDAAVVDLEALRRFGAAAARAAARCRRLALRLDGLVALADPVAAARAVGEGAGLASHRFARYRAADGSALEAVLLVGAPLEAVDAGARAASVVAEAVCLARDLVNTPASDLTPPTFASLAAEVATSAGVEARVLDEAAIAEAGLGGLLGVARGSAEPPRLVRLERRVDGRPDAPTVALVGKGITFDSGGLSLKGAEAMETMKTDMSGAAAVLAAIVGAARLDLPTRLVGYLPLTENMPGGRATKPGDVLTIRNGRTIEVLNTDAEGRLVLADALSLAAEERPDAIVDLATLTGACVVALGRAIAGLMGNDDRLLAALEAAARRAGEPVWQLPLPAGYRRQLDSEVADLKNVGAPRQAGALVAGLVLEEFVGSVPWAHLDIAGPARAEEDAGYLRKGGTGFGVRTLLAFLEAYEPLGGQVAGETRGRSLWR